MAKSKNVSEKRKAFQAKLMVNPKYDSDWVDNASRLMEDFDFSEADMQPYNASQLDAIYDAYDFEKNNAEAFAKNKYTIDMVEDPRLNATQMRLMIAGWTNNIPRKVLYRCINEDVPYEVANYVLQAYIEGYDISEYVTVNSGFNVDQIYEIYCGLHNKIDATRYAKAEIPAKTMGVIRHFLELGCNDITYTINSDNVEITAKMPIE